MKKKYFVLLICIILINLSTPIFSQQEAVEIKKHSDIIPNYTELRTIHSKIIDDDYYLYIKLPKDYEETDSAYPVIYLLDGDIAFTMAWSSVRYLQYGKELPDVIIVGIGYGSLLSSDEENMRERDYTISKLSNRSESGGGENFLKFLKSELIPYVDSEYRTNPKKRIINGYSFGGLFVMYTLVNEPELFRGWIAGSPYLSFDNEYLLEQMNHPSDQLKNSNSKLFISFGELEDEDLYAKPITEIVAKLNELNFDKTQIRKRVFEGGTHFTCPSEAMVYGLKFLFE